MVWSVLIATSTETPFLAAMSESTWIIYCGKLASKLLNAAAISGVAMRSFTNLLVLRGFCSPHYRSGPAHVARNRWRLPNPGTVGGGKNWISASVMCFVLASDFSNDVFDGSFTLIPWFQIDHSHSVRGTAYSVSRL